jgi:hypothetical protein
MLRHPFVVDLSARWLPHPATTTRGASGAVPRREAVSGAVAELGSEACARGGLLAAIRELADGALALQAAGGPSMVIDAVQALLEEGTGAAVGQLVADLSAAVQRLPEKEDWLVLASSHKSGAAARPSVHACLSV